MEVLIFFIYLLFFLAKETLRRKVQEFRLGSPLLMVKAQKGKGPLLMVGQPNPLGVGELRFAWIRGRESDSTMMAEESRNLEHREETKVMAKTSTNNGDGAEN